MNKAKAYGCEDFIGYMPDSFGHNSEIPRILTSFCVNDAVVWRGVGEQKSEFMEIPDGSSVFTTYLIEGYFQDILNQTRSAQKKKRKK
ncbi:MAG: hypothetical protein MZU97_06220 [Bacillus subtilis]|nr:hypothetical protein [Bacillus subtilis]